MSEQSNYRIKSFVIRAGRMTESQQKGWSSVFPAHGFMLSEIVIFILQLPIVQNDNVRDSAATHVQEQKEN